MKINTIIALAAIGIGLYGGTVFAEGNIIPTSTSSGGSGVVSHASYGFRKTTKETPVEDKKSMVKISKKNPVALKDDRIIVGVQNYDFHDDGARVNFTIKVQDGYKDTSSYRVSKIKGRAEIKFLAKNGDFWRESSPMDSVVPISQDTSDYLDMYIWERQAD